MLQEAGKVTNNRKFKGPRRVTEAENAVLVRRKR